MVSWQFKSICRHIKSGDAILCLGVTKAQLASSQLSLLHFYYNQFQLQDTAYVTYIRSKLLPSTYKVLHEYDDLYDDDDDYNDFDEDHQKTILKDVSARPAPSRLFPARSSPTKL